MCIRHATIFLFAFLLAGCPDRNAGQAARNQSPEPPAQGASTMELTTSAFKPGQPIPRKYTGQGDDVSPPLQIHNVPAAAKQLALICDDPDAPTAKPWVHWLLYNLPPDTTELPEALPRTPTLDAPAGACQGKNSWSDDNVGYRGPMPPPGHGVHHYRFFLYALDEPLDLAPGLTREQLDTALQGHILAETQLTGTYER